MQCRRRRCCRRLAFHFHCHCHRRRRRRRHSPPESHTYSYAFPGPIFRCFLPHSNKVELPSFSRVSRHLFAVLFLFILFSFLIFCWMFATPTVPVLFALLLASARMCHGYFYLYSRILPHYSYVIFNAVTPQTAPVLYSPFCSLLPFPSTHAGCCCCNKSWLFQLLQENSIYSCFLPLRACCVHIFFYFVFHFIFSFYAQAYQTHISVFKSYLPNSPHAV